jgi:hypothetical protein
VLQSDALGRTSEGDHGMSLQIHSHCPIYVTQRHPSVYIVPLGETDVRETIELGGSELGGFLGGSLLPTIFSLPANHFFVSPTIIPSFQIIQI